MLNAKEIVDTSLATIDELHLTEIAKKNVTVDILRLDKIHPVISGNKWFKLKYYLQDAVRLKKSIITFGGAYSNHIIATAFAAKELSLPSLGIIRGEEPYKLSPTLIKAKEYGMQLEFIARNQYLKKNDRNFITDFGLRYTETLIIPEGGSGINGIRGSSEIMSLVNADKYTHIACAVGTATTFSGIANATSSTQKMIGICVLKGMLNLLQDDVPFLNNPEKIPDCYINYDYHFGGYAKKNNELFYFMNWLFDKTRIPTDFVYTAKLFYGIIDLLRKDYFPHHSSLLIIHSGGLQGNNSLPQATLNFN
jgi:1-aminocyclopropane-1-carboxylate deaminase